MQCTTLYENVNTLILAANIISPPSEKCSAFVNLIGWDALRLLQGLDFVRESSLNPISRLVLKAGGHIGESNVEKENYSRKVYRILHGYSFNFLCRTREL
jgi:hypothetical protein